MCAPNWKCITSVAPRCMSFPGAVCAAGRRHSRRVSIELSMAQSYLEGYRRGDCLSRIVVAHSGAPRASRDRVACDLYGGADFQKGFFPTALGKLGGPESCPAIPGRRGRVREARKERQLPGLDAYNTAASGGLKRTILRAVLPTAISRRSGGATPNEKRGAGPYSYPSAGNSAASLCSPFELERSSVRMVSALSSTTSCWMTCSILSPLPVETLIVRSYSCVVSSPCTNT